MRKKERKRNRNVKFMINLNKCVKNQQRAPPFHFNCKSGLYIARMSTCSQPCIHRCSSRLYLNALLAVGWMSDVGLPALISTLWAVGCQLRMPTRLECPSSLTTGSFRGDMRPPSGISQIYYITTLTLCYNKQFELEHHFHIQICYSGITAGWMLDGAILNRNSNKKN